MINVGVISERGGASGPLNSSRSEEPVAYGRLTPGSPESEGFIKDD